MAQVTSLLWPTTIPISLSRNMINVTSTFECASAKVTARLQFHAAAMQIKVPPSQSVQLEEMGSWPVSQTN